MSDPATWMRFDTACDLFSMDMRRVAAWKHNYYGAAYTTRLKQAIQEGRAACDRLEADLIAMGEISGPVDKSELGA